MSDILIKGMEMPKGNNVLVVDSAGTITKVNRWTGKVEVTDPLSVKAVALPEHGKAKDTDIAIKYIKSEMEDDFNETTTLDEKSYKEGMKRAIELIGYAPTILEAST